MSKQKVGIVTDCVCDLPKSYIKEHDIGIVYFLIETDTGVFTDTDEITAENILGYIKAGGKKIISSPPAPEIYKNVFSEKIEKYDEIIYISIGSGTSASYSNACKAVSLMGEDGKKVRVFDSKHLSTGMGLIIIKAAEMAETGADTESIIKEIADLREHVSTTFIAVNTDYIARNGKVSQNVRKFCSFFGIHPVLMMKDGKIALKSVMIGNYERAGERYIQKELKNPKNINKDRIFLTHVGIGANRINHIKEVIYKKCRTDNIIETNASATVSSNCGPGTFGVLFVREKEAEK